MNAHQERVFQSFRRVQGWWAANQSYVVEWSPAVATAVSAQLDALRGIVDRLTTHVTQQETQQAQTLLISKDEREQRKELLSHHMATIVKLAKALRGQVPGIGVLAMPKGNVQSAALITAASVMARKAEIYRAVLVDNGLPTDFVEQLEAAAGELKRSLDARGLARGARTAAARGIETELGLGRRVVDIMDATLARALRREPVKFAEWRHVQRVTQRGSVSRVSEDAIESSPILENLSPTAARSSPTVVQPPPTAAQMLPTLAQGSPTPANSSPSEVEASPTVREKAA